MAEDLEEDFDEEGEGSEQQPEETPVKLPIKKILIIVLPILLLLGAGAGLYFTGVIDSMLGKGHGEAAAPHAEAAPHAVGPAAFMEVPEMLVNLQSSGRKQAFLKIRVALELENILDQQKIDPLMPRILDAFQVYLRELRIEDLQGAAGMHLLREELLTRVNVAVKPTKVNDILFKEMLVQ